LEGNHNFLFLGGKKKRKSMETTLRSQIHPRKEKEKMSDLAMKEKEKAQSCHFLHRKNAQLKTGGGRGLEGKTLKRETGGGK